MGNESLKEEYFASFGAGQSTSCKLSCPAQGDHSTTTNCFEPYCKDSKLAKAYDRAEEIRRFEIELYWKRSGSFWLMVAGLLTILGLLASGKVGNQVGGLLDKEHLNLFAFTVCCAGTVLSYAWYLVNKASKFWQRNWEYHVDLLEERALGPLYKTVLARDESNQYSASKINSAISGYVGSLFLLGALFFFGIGGPVPIGCDGLLLAKLIVLGLNVIAVFLISGHTKTASSVSQESLNLKFFGTRRQVDIEKVVERKNNVSD